MSDFSPLDFSNLPDDQLLDIWSGADSSGNYQWAAEALEEFFSRYPVDEDTSHDSSV